MAKSFLDEVQFKATPNATGNIATVAVDGTLSTRTPAQTLGDIGAFPAPSYTTGWKAVTLTNNVPDADGPVISASATANTLAYRGTGGTLQVGTPTAGNHAVTKDYADALGGGDAMRDGGNTFTGVQNFTLPSDSTAGMVFNVGAKTMGSVFGRVQTTPATEIGTDFIINSDRLLVPPEGGTDTSTIGFLNKRGTDSNWSAISALRILDSDGVATSSVQAEALGVLAFPYNVSFSATYLGATLESTTGAGEHLARVRASGNSGASWVETTVSNGDGTNVFGVFASYTNSDKVVRAPTPETGNVSDLINRSFLTTALAAKADDSAVVKTIGNQTVAGVKTFSSFPVLPSSAPTTDYQAATKKYVDDNKTTDASLLTSGTLPVARIAAGSITTTQLGDSSVNSDKLTVNSVATGAIQDLAITTGKIAAASVTIDKLKIGATYNMVINPEWLDGVTFPWTGSSGTVFKASSSGMPAKRICEITANGSAYMTASSNKFEVSPGETYFVQADINTPDAGFEVLIQCFNESGTAFNWQTVSATSGAGWRQVSGLVLIPSGAREAQLVFQATPSAANATVGIFTNPRVIRASEGRMIPDAAITTAKLVDNAVTAQKTERLQMRTVTAGTTLAIGDMDACVRVDATASSSVTVPLNATVAFPIGTVVEILRWGYGAVPLIAASGVSIQAPGGFTSGTTVIGTRYASVFLRKLATNVWLLQGDLA